VAILDADKEGFLRSHVSLIQTIGRAARHLSGQVIMYADQVTASMQRALEETDRRREVQRRYNEEHGITPKSVRKNILDLSQFLYDGSPVPLAAAAEGDDLLTKAQIQELVEEYSRRMQEAADQMEFETAADLRDKVLVLKDMDLGLKPPSRALVMSTHAKKQEQGKELPRFRRGAMRGGAGAARGGNRRRR
jgi:excinuclease ABC subunit B